ncbi:unnamed protein product [Schistosoma mattheei]|uniref:Uncharacterized protein n=1 Tax=Schistosoma mattheei TaxID=31246 RepID=A0A3P8C0W8_9TREM|nr:unnamed protein product [Schistosoma mattheei]
MQFRLFRNILLRIVFVLCLKVSPELPWPGCREFYSARDNWLRGINPIHFTYGGRRVFSTNSPTVSTDNQFVILDCGLLQTVNTSILQSVGILRLVDITVSCVSYPNSVLKQSDPSTLFSKSSQMNKTFRDNNNNARIKAEIPVDKNIFIGSDKFLHNLPDTSSFLTIEFKNHYWVDDTPSSSSSNQSLPCSLFCQINPFYINFDPDTVIWLNIFLLALQLNLVLFWLTLVSQRYLQSSGNSSCDSNSSPSIAVKLVTPELFGLWLTSCGISIPK